MSLHIDIAMPPTLQVDEVSPETVAATSVVAMERKRRGKAIKWKYVKKYATIAEAKENFTRGNLTQKEQFLGRKYNGKTSAIYINCQKVICGCRKKWRLVSCVTASHVVLEETSEDHSHHDLFVRSGGHGLSQEQITLTQEALLLNSRMKPLQIVNFFCDRAARDLALDPSCTTIATPDIVRLSSYMSYQRRKQSGALASVSSRKLLKATKIEIVDGGRILIPLEIEDILQSLHPLEKLKNTTEQFPIENLNIENVNVENCGNIPQNVSQNVPQNVPQNIVEEDCMAVCEGITFTETKLSAL